MPVTIYPVSHDAETFKSSAASSPEKLIESACPKQWRRCQRVVQTSLTKAFSDDDTHITPSENGFVWAAYQAYSHHHHLVLRPEDIWFAILTQLSFYINAHAEELRAFFVPHEDKKELEAFSDIADFGALSLQMTNLLAKNVNDPALKEWVMPNFSTTTHHDLVVGAVLFMGALQAYFEYKMTVCCGLPSVTLLGEVDDWRKILGGLDMIDQLGEEPKLFAGMLRPILMRMVLTFDDPGSHDVVDFWNRVVHHHPVGSGTDYLSGWLTAFCYWDDEGKPKRMQSAWRDEGNVLFDGVEYPFVDIDEVPLGYASVPVKVDDNGYEYEATMVAGSIGIAASSSNRSMATPTVQGEQQVLSDDTNRNTLQPLSAWFMLENEKKELAEERAAEKKRLKEKLAQFRAEMDCMDRDGRLSFYKSKGWNEYLDVSRQMGEMEAF